MESSPRSQGDRTPSNDLHTKQETLNNKLHCYYLDHQVVFPEDSDIPIPPLPKKHCSTKVEVNGF